MAEYVTKEEFDTLTEKFNELVNMLTDLELKQKVDFSELEYFNEETDSDIEDEEDNEIEDSKELKI